MKIISIVVPIYNEHENILLLSEEITAILTHNNIQFELLFIDDGSQDNSWNIIRMLHSKHDNILGLRFSRNFGHQAAILAGITYAKGDAIITMDGDFQHPPSLLPRLIIEWERGAQVVLTRRIDHSDIIFTKRITSRAYYALHSLLSDQPIQPGSSDFRLIDKSIRSHIIKLKYSEVFLRGAVEFLGFPSVTVSFVANKRRAGISKFTFKKMLYLARGGLIAHSSAPLYISIYNGIFSGTLCIVYIIYAVTMYLSDKALPGWTSLIAVNLALFSIHFLTQGITSLYIDDIHRLIKNRPKYIINDRAGI